MSNATYDALWQQAISELDEQLHVEGADDEAISLDTNNLTQLGIIPLPNTSRSTGQKPSTSRPNTGTVGTNNTTLQQVTIYQAYQHFACLYIRYLQIYKKLEKCYDCMIHPQKRIHVKTVLELVIRRILELRADLVRWNPPNSYVRMPGINGIEEAFPWEYFHLDEILVDLKLSPEVLEIVVPRYFRDDNRRTQEQRDRIISGFYRLRGANTTNNISTTTTTTTTTTHIPTLVDVYDSPIVTEVMSLERAIEIIQRNERGRQGIARAAKTKAAVVAVNSVFSGTAKAMMDSDIAATIVQRMISGYVSRVEAARERENELMFIGMLPPTGGNSNDINGVVALERELEVAYFKRKQDQRENSVAYESALEELKEVIADEEGPEKREEYREERTLYVTDQIAQEKFPDNLDDFYRTKQFLEGGGETEVVPKSANKSTKPSKSGKSSSSGKKPAKGGKGTTEPEAPMMPKLQGRTALTDAMAISVKEYENVWDGRDETDNFQQRHDVNLAKEVLRPGVYETIRLQVDEMLLMNLKKIKLQVQNGKKKGKKAGKKKGKKGKKGKGGKKKKPLPGEKLAELKGMETDQMLSMLIDHGLVVKPRQRKISSLIGEFNYLGTTHHLSDRQSEGKWEPQDPSMAQLRQAIVEYCILPNGSSTLKQAISNPNAATSAPAATTAPGAPLIKSVMLYGPAGTGKTHAVEAVAHELGGLLIHLSPAKLRGQFAGKSGTTKLVHLVMTVARDPAMQPVVIYIDECESFFPAGGKRNKDKDGPSRLKKELLLYKNQALTAEHRVIIIGTTSRPETADLKDIRNFFDKFLYFPYPDYASRVLLWRHYMTSKIREGLVYNHELSLANAAAAGNGGLPMGANMQLSEEEIVARIRSALEKVDLSSLAHISEGYATGMIARTIKAVLTPRRVAMLRSRPLSNLDFVDHLALQEVTYANDRAVFLEFTTIITGLADRRKRVEAAVAGDTAGGKGGKKSGKDAKGKKK